MRVTAGEKTSVTGLKSRLQSLEATDSVRWVMARYMELCDVPQPDVDLAELGDLFTLDATWEGVGVDYSKKFGWHTGRESILRMLTGRLPAGPLLANAHLLGEGRINVQGSIATGSWIMHQISHTEAEGVHCAVARVKAAFDLSETSARIKAFSTERLFTADTQLPGLRSEHPNT